MRTLRVLVALLVLGWGGVAWAADFAVQGGAVGPATDNIKMITCTKAQSDAGTCNSLGDFVPTQAIKGFKLIAGSAGSQCGLYDAATVSGTTGLFDELYQATANATSLHVWTSPYKLVTDLSVNVVGIGAVCIVYY